MTQKDFWKIFPDKFFVVFLKFFRFYFQLRQQKPLTYYARGKTINGNNLNRWKSYPYNENKLFLRKNSWNEAGKISQKSSSLMTRNQKFWKKSGKIFQETLWVTTRFLEKFSRIWQYGLRLEIKTSVHYGIFLEHLGIHSKYDFIDFSSKAYRASKSTISI